MRYNTASYNRRFPRLKDYDYSQSGIYFVTICTHNKEKMFGEIVEDRMHLNSVGEIAKNVWNDLPQRFSDLTLDHYVFMPNHFHGLLVFSDSFPPNESNRQYTLGDVVRTFKAVTCRYVHLSGASKFQWQQKYWDSIIRSEEHLDTIRQYIINNPVKWQE